ncbi:hypothetical protein BDR26DRAFT_859863 [Obelidium mucronatum]|nr:hypothetical protein BDR26DRAFT_859863 [Obelidium mucronatum]
MVHPQTGVRSYALVNTNPDEVSQLSTQMNPNEIAFFKRLIYLIMTADDDVFQITTSDALRESKVAKLKATETEALLDSIIQNGWLDLNNGWLSLSLRALMELKTYLREEYEDSVQYCYCYERCAIGACPGRLHKFCAGRYFGSCGSAWEGITPVPSNSGARRGDGSSKRRQMRSDNADSDDSDADKEGNLDGFVVADGEDEGGEGEEE